jgi:hypothetical protein
MKELSRMVELTGAELDAVAAGQGNGRGLGVGGLVGAGVGVGIGNIDVDVSDVIDVNNNTFRILSDSEFLNNNNVAIGVAAAILGITAQAVRAINP